MTADLLKILDKSGAGFVIYIKVHRKLGKIPTGLSEWRFSIITEEVKTYIKELIRKRPMPLSLA